jgi:hypothetical protein
MVNLSYRPPVSKQQKLFDSWVKELIAYHNNNPKDRSLNITIEAEAIGEDGSTLWQLIATPDQLSSARLLRILTLAKEAQLFSTTEPRPSEKDQLQVNIKIASKNQSFTVGLKQETIAKRIQAITMLALLREYTQQNNKSTHVN